MATVTLVNSSFVGERLLRIGANRNVGADLADLSVAVRGLARKVSKEVENSSQFGSEAWAGFKPA